MQKLKKDETLTEKAKKSPQENVEKKAESGARKRFCVSVGKRVRIIQQKSKKMQYSS